MDSKVLPQDYDNLAPDGSQIRLLPRLSGGSLAHCTLLPGQISQAVAHKKVEEIWYFLQGRGQFWCKTGNIEQEIDVYPEVSLTIPVGTHFQFRNTGDEPLCFLIVTMPPWTTPDEAYAVPGRWTPAGDAGREKA